MQWVNAIIQGLLTGGLYALFACGLSLMSFRRYMAGEAMF